MLMLGLGLGVEVGLLLGPEATMLGCIEGQPSMVMVLAGHIKKEHTAKFIVAVDVALTENDGHMSDVRGRDGLGDDNRVG